MIMREVYYCVLYAQCLCGKRGWMDHFGFSIPHIIESFDDSMDS